MTQPQLDRAVAGRHRRVAPHRPPPRLRPQAPPPAPTPATSRLVVDCPFCGRPVRLPGPAAGGAAGDGRVRAGCDVYFDFDAAEVYAAGREADGQAP